MREAGVHPMKETKLLLLSERQSTEWEKYLQMMQLTGINLQNIQTAHTTQYQKFKQPNQKVGKDPNRYFFKVYMWPTGS